MRAAVSSLLLRGFALGSPRGVARPISSSALGGLFSEAGIHGLVSGLVRYRRRFHAAVASFGVAAVTTAIAGGRRPLAVVGGAALIAIGVRILLQRRQEPSRAGCDSKHRLSPGLTLHARLTIPTGHDPLVRGLAATLDWAPGRDRQPAVLVAGVLIGSAAWWCVLAVGQHRCADPVTPSSVASARSAARNRDLGMLAIYSAFS